MPALTLDLTTTFDSTNGQIVVAGFTTGTNTAWTDVDGGNTEAIQTVEFNTWVGCDSCSSCSDDDYLLATNEGITLGGSSTYYSNTADDTIKIEPEAFQKTEFTYGVYHVRFFVTGDDASAAEWTQEYHVCIFVADEIVCTIIKAIVDDEVQSDDLVTVFEALTYANTCANCCKTCELYEYLNTLIDNLENCETC
jgi:hypothetical protein